MKDLEKRKKKAAKIVKVLKKLLPKATKTILKFSNPWELTVAVQLAAQCTDKKVNEVTEKLFKKYPRLDSYLRAKRSEFEKDVRPTGFYRAKAGNILRAARKVKEDFRGKVPKTMAELITIPGIGRKSANMILGNAYGLVEGVAVDTHVKRLTKILGLTDETDPNKIEKDLMQILPKREWLNFNHRLVEYGRHYCPARPHNHSQCPLSNLK